MLLCKVWILRSVSDNEIRQIMQTLDPQQNEQPIIILIVLFNT